MIAQPIVTFNSIYYFVGFDLMGGAVQMFFDVPMLAISYI